ncbi:MAG: hypothetical protein JNL68_18655 [Burkholderiales bacterium]|nr:hypothetical protein [Burkholderiales bacterium]
MTTLLVMTAGQTDVQLVVNEQRHKLDGNTCGTLHDAIKERSWSVVDAPRDRCRDLTKVLPEGDVPLCTPKLDAVLAHLAPSLPTSVLIFETRRQDARDPRFAGEVMDRRLRDRGVENVTRVAFLSGDERLEDPLNEVDAVVRRAIVATLSNAIGLATANMKPEDRVFVATTGGLAAANELINELVRLHCVGGPRVTALEVPDGDHANQVDRAVEEKFHPAAGYGARWHALSLVGKGNLHGAWGAVSHLEGAPGQEWTQVLKWLAHFASSLPLPAQCDLAVLNHQRMAVRAGLRVELALRAGDIPRAVHGTVAFFEAALWDRLGERIERSSDPTRRRFFKIKSGDAPTGDKLLRQSDGSDDDRKRPFELKDTDGGIGWYWVYDGDGGPGARIAKHFLRSDALTKFDRALGNNIRELRNDIAHNEPTPSLMNDARTRMQDAKLWSSTDTFLSESLVQDVLKELGESTPEMLLKNLLVNVREQLVSSPHPVTPNTSPPKGEVRDGR